MAIAALDFGRRWIGIAVTDGIGLGVYSVETIERRSLRRDLELICARLAELEVTLVVVGLPLNMDGTAGPQAHAAEAFACQLRTVSGLAVELFDERLTSFEAEERMKAIPFRRKHRNSHAIDAVAACVILEGWLQSRTQAGVEAKRQRMKG
jgi:putative holliday junction resolvase